MLLGELIDRLDKSDANKVDIDVDDLQDILQCNFYISMNLDNKKANTRVSCYWLACWYNNEGLYGYKVYFLDDKLLGICYKEYEDDIEDFTFINSSIKKDLKDYILSFAKEEEEQSCHNLNLNEDWKEGFKVSHAHNLYPRINKYVIYEGQKCKIIYPTYVSNGKEYEGCYKYDYKSDNNSLITIELPNSERIIIDLFSVNVCYNII